MHKLIAVLFLASALGLSQGAKAQRVDLAHLPSIDSINATTDIRSFLAPGVPLEIVRAALRRAWVTDPRIRDFRELQENDWDFSNPSGIPGFGRLEIANDVKVLVAPMFADAGMSRSRRQ
jgi:hypothetical protein